MRVKLLSIILLFVVFFGVVGCKDEINESEAYQISVKLPDEAVMQRLDNLGDGTTAAKLYYYVYESGKDDVFLSGTVLFDEDTQTATLPTLYLPMGYTYELALIAQPTNKQYNYNEAERTITREPMTATVVRTKEYGDVFYAYEVITPELLHSRSITMKRATAQLNICTNTADWNAIKNPSWTYSPAQVFLEITNTYPKFDIKNGIATGTPAKFEATMRIDDYNLYDSPVSGTKLLASYYFFTRTTNVNVKINMQEQTGSNPAVTKLTIDVPNVPVETNYRTNIYGNLFTETHNYTIEKNPNWSGTKTSGL